MTKHFQVYLCTDSPSVTYSCVHCRAHLSDHKDLISKSFQGSQGRAYLFDKVVNVKTGVAEDRLLLTGQHRVADLHCSCCSALLGWKYEKAFEPSQRYKEGKCIIELANLIKENGWDNNITPRMKRKSSGYCTASQMSPLTPLRSPTDESFRDLGGWRNQGFFDSTGELFEEEAANDQFVNLPSTSFDDSQTSRLSAQRPFDVVIETEDDVAGRFNYISTLRGEGRQSSEAGNTEGLQIRASSSSVDLINNPGASIQQQPSFVTFDSGLFPLEDDYFQPPLFAPWDVELTPSTQPLSLFSLSLGRLRRSDRSRYPIDPSVPLLSATEEVLRDLSASHENHQPACAFEKRLTASVSLDSVFFSCSKWTNSDIAELGHSRLPMVFGDFRQVDAVGEPSLWQTDSVTKSNSEAVPSVTEIDVDAAYVFNALD